jgi:RimJ/RimL family protein N-acetyltransferase
MIEARATSEVLIRDVEEQDIPIFFEHQLDPEAIDMAAFPSRDRDAHSAHWTKILADNSVITKTVVFEGQVAGNVVSWEQDDRRLVGYWIGKDHWGMGVATEALSQFLDRVPERPFYAFVAGHNLGSIRVLQKCGFTTRAQETPTGSDVSQVEELVMELKA